MSEWFERPAKQKPAKQKPAKHCFKGKGKVKYKSKPTLYFEDQLEKTDN
jgi:hypothetical protein